MARRRSRLPDEGIEPIQPSISFPVPRFEAIEEIGEERALQPMSHPETPEGLTSGPDAATTNLVEEAALSPSPDRWQRSEGLNRYLQAVSAYPKLTLEQERELTHRLYYARELEAAKDLTLHHLQFVVRIARGFTGYGLPLPDLVQEGNIGLIKAINRYNPAFQVRLTAFAIHWIKAEIYQFVLKNWRLVRIATTKRQRKLFFNLRKVQRLIGPSGGTPAEASRILQVPLPELKSMADRMASPEVSLHSGTSLMQPSSALAQLDGSRSSEGGLESTLSDPRSNFSEELEEQQWKYRLLQRLHHGLQRLDARSLAIVHGRWISEPKKTLQELSAAYGVSLERIRQLEKKAIGALKSYLSTEIPNLPKGYALALPEPNRSAVLEAPKALC